MDCAEETNRSCRQIELEHPGQKREKWANKTEFILSSLGYAIGIGNVWRFPYLCYRSGGGAFLIPYLIMLVFCGIPLYFLETSLGQFTSSGFLTVFNMAPLFKGAGVATIVVNVIVTTYFVMLYAYPLLFLYYSFDADLPWDNCNNSWNTEFCIKLEESTSVVHLNESQSLILSKPQTSSEEFFNKGILQISDSINEIGGVVWPLFTCNTLAWAATYLCMSNGIKSIGKVVYFTATFPFVILLVLLLRGVTLPGALNGIYFYIYPQWDQLANFKVWCDAAVQIFYSLGPGWGGIISMSSYNNFYNNNRKDSILVPICNSATSIIAGFVVFSVLGFMSHKTGIPVSSVASSGPGLAFITYPEAISLLPWSNLWAILFFVMLFFLGMSSVFVSVEAIINSVTDEFPKMRPHKRLMGCFTCCGMWAGSTIFTMNSGMYWLTLFDWYSASITIILITIFEVVMVGWTYGVTHFIADIEFMIKEKLSCFWLISWKLTTPLILITMFLVTIFHNTEVSYNDQKYPQWAIEVGWMSCYVSMACIPLYMGYHLLYIEDGDFINRITSSVSPLKWCFESGPADNHIKLQWIREVKFKQICAEIKRIKQKGRKEYAPYEEELVQFTTTV